MQYKNMIDIPLVVKADKSKLIEIVFKLWQDLATQVSHLFIILFYLMLFVSNIL